MQPELMPLVQIEPSCGQCVRRRIGPLSGIEYCGDRVGPEWISTHQARQERGPCGPAGRMFLLNKRAA
jgi:hypothetical protein